MVVFVYRQLLELLRKQLTRDWRLKEWHSQWAIIIFIFFMKRGFERYAAMYNLSMFCHFYNMKTIFAASDRTCIVHIYTPRKKAPHRGIFARLNFFSTCAAPAQICVNRFGCGFFLGFTFFTEYFSDNVFKVFRHTLRGELTMKFNNI